MLTVAIVKRVDLKGTLGKDALEFILDDAIFDDDGSDNPTYFGDLDIQQQVEVLKDIEEQFTEAINEYIHYITI